MCSIIGCSFQSDVAPTIVRGLQKMEYRGYDSVGACTFDKQLNLARGVGKVQDVNRKQNLDKLPGGVGIGHTRWATHGKVSEDNAHPHVDTLLGKIAIVHNGIIENHEELKAEFGFTHNSDTDSEVIANLLAHFYIKRQDPKKAVLEVVKYLKGHYAFLAIFDDETLVAVRNHEPIIVGLAPLGYIVASDVLGFIESTDQAIYLENKEFAVIEPPKVRGMTIYNFEGKEVKHKTVQLSREVADAYKEDYAHFTIKEIHEQIHTVKKIQCNTPECNTFDAARMLCAAKSIYFTGSGTSYNACLIGKYLLNKHKIKVEPIISSECPFLNHDFDEKSVLLAISQSGESADVLETVLMAKHKGAKIIAVVNKTASTLAGISDLVLPINCGPEIGVAATKSFTSQILLLAGIASHIQFENIDFKSVSNCVKQALREENKVREIAYEIKDVSDIYILGRGINHPIASEASLKIKELAYIHAEGLAGGELKHGPLALIDESSYVILLHPSDETYSDMEISGKQVKSRGAKIIGIAERHNSLYDHWIEVPAGSTEIERVVSEIIPIQLLAYYIALAKNYDPDYPRNLAKSVTTK
jgi:glucosamine--fructose-6-phosphate aminotransferase (isomerizing)